MKIHRRIIVSILLLSFISCTTSNQGIKIDNLQTEDRTATLTIEFENSQENKATFKLHLCKELYDTMARMKEKCEFKVIEKLGEKDVVKYDLPPGDYYSMFELTDKIVLPLLFYESTAISIKFGYKEETRDYFLYGKTDAKQNDIAYCERKGSSNKYYECPKLSLKDNTLTTFRFKIDKDYEFDAEGTTLIWVGSVWLSLQVRFPIPLPLFMGFFAIKRDIKHNLK